MVPEFVFFSTIFIQQLEANIILNVLFTSEQTNAKATKQINIPHNILTLNSSEDI